MSMDAPVPSDTLVQVRDLKMHFPITEGAIVPRVVAHVKAVDGISFDIRKGETLGLVGESGCGKTTTGRCILQLEKATAGEIIFDGQDLNTLNKQEMRPLRQRIQVIFQDPYSSLNPRMKIGDIISEPMMVHQTEPDKAARDARVRELLGVCGLNPAFADRYPHEMSGGQRQRVGIARALAVKPEFIICDEAVSALDVSIQAQVLAQAQVVVIGGIMVPLISAAMSWCRWRSRSRNKPLNPATGHQVRAKVQRCSKRGQ